MKLCGSEFIKRRFEAESAGVALSFVRPKAVEAMREIGIDISRHRSKSVDEFAGQQFDYVITVCDNAKEQCPAFPGKTKRIYWSFDDQAEASGDVAENSPPFAASAMKSGRS